MPQVGAGLHGHLDAVAGVHGAGLQVAVGDLGVAGHHVAAGLEAAGAQAHAAVGLDRNLLAVLLHDDAHHGALGVGHEALAGAALPHGELVVVDAGVDGSHAQVVVAGVEAGARGGEALAVHRLGDLGELVPAVDVALAAQAPGVVGEDPGVGHAGLALGHRGGAHDVGIAAHGAAHPLEVLGAALAIAHQGLFVPVGELAHELGEVGVEALGVVGGHDELAGRLGVAGLLTLGGLLAHEDLRALLVGRDGGVGAGAAQAQDHDVVLGVPSHVVGSGRRRIGPGHARGTHGTHSAHGGGTPHEVPAIEFHCLVLSCLQSVDRFRGTSHASP